MQTQILGTPVPASQSLPIALLCRFGQVVTRVAVTAGSNPLGTKARGSVTSKEMVFIGGVSPVLSWVIPHRAQHVKSGAHPSSTGWEGAIEGCSIFFIERFISLWATQNYYFLFFFVPAKLGKISYLGMNTAWHWMFDYLILIFLFYKKLFSFNLITTSKIASCLQYLS